MIVIQEVIVSDEIFTEQFICNLSACKGACCWEGDYGAPLRKDEIRDIEANMEGIAAFIPEENLKVIQEKGSHTAYTEPGFIGTELMPDKACVFMNRNELGIAYCGIEAAYNAGIIAENKPLSCHLYPIRVTVNEHTGFEAWNYDRWDICNPACALGAAEKVPIFKFLKDAIIRYKGMEFYEEMEAFAEYFESK